MNRVLKLLIGAIAAYPTAALATLPLRCVG
jgi:hypothetical protein